MRKLVLDLAMTPSLVRLLRSGRYECVHAVEEAAYLVAALRGNTPPLLYDMQSSIPEQLNRQVRLPPGAARLLRAGERWLLERADIVVASAGLADTVRRQVPGGRVREWTFFSALPETTDGEVEELRRELELAADRPVVLYAGNFAPYQGFDTLLEAASRVVEAVPDVCFVLVGASDSELRQVGERGSNLIGSGHVRLVARQPRRQISAFLALADLCVSPRAWGDNLPLKIFEYLSAGKPIVATDIHAHRALLSDSHAVLVPNTSAGLQAGILRLLSDKPLAEKLARSGRAHAKADLGWKAFVRQVETLYQEVKLGRRATSGSS
jgi:glycosyltransferase involved in cell wall biosynthesis